MARGHRRRCLAGKRGADAAQGAFVPGDVSGRDRGEVRSRLGPRCGVRESGPGDGSRAHEDDERKRADDGHRRRARVPGTPGTHGAMTASAVLSLAVARGSAPDS